MFLTCHVGGRYFHVGVHVDEIKRRASNVKERIFKDLGRDTWRDLAWEVSGLLWKRRW